MGLWGVFLRFLPSLTVCLLVWGHRWCFGVVVVTGRDT